MLDRKKLVYLIPALILIPIILGMTPLNMAHKLSSGGPFVHGKQGCAKNHCLFHSLTPHHDLTVGILSSTLLDQDAQTSLELCFTVCDPLHSNISFSSIPLRC
jgi:hypothetical protein